MRGSRFTETQIGSILNKTDAGPPVKDIYRRQGSSLRDSYPRPRRPATPPHRCRFRRAGRVAASNANDRSRTRMTTLYWLLVSPAANRVR